MSQEDDPYSLSPESIFVKQPTAYMPSRLETFTLALIRSIIVVALGITLLGSVGLAYFGYISLNEEPRAYPVALPTAANERFIARIKQDATDASRLTTVSASATADVKPAEVSKNDFVDKQWNRQLALLNDFLVPFGRSVTQAPLFKERQQALGLELAASTAPRDQLDYARAQSDFFERVLGDRATVQMVRLRAELHPPYLDTFMNQLLDEYPNQLREERRTRSRFEQEERQRLEAARAQSTRMLLAALALFVAFLGLGAVYMLVRIERHLRMGSNIVQVMATPS